MNGINMNNVIPAHPYDLSGKVAYNKYATTVKIIMGILDRSLQLHHVTISLNHGYIPCFMLKVPIGHDYFITKHEYCPEFTNITCFSPNHTLFIPSSTPF